MSDLAPLEAEIRRRIAVAGPMPVAEYMGLCLAHPQYGYYVTTDPLGLRGDFITAPEVSQMFGELIGLWLATIWQQLGSPENIRLVELGPGRGTLLRDALRASRIVPGFADAVVLHLVEINPLLKTQQEVALEALGVPALWHTSFRDVPKGPALIVANEFFDALPVNQAVKMGDGWHERQVGLDGNGRLAFTAAEATLAHFERLLPAPLREAAEGAIFEWRADTVALDLGKRIAREGGAALIIDYGHAESGIGDTLQAVGQHAFADPLTACGALDLTAHVDFAQLAAAFEAIGARAHGPVTQSVFLRRLGIEARANTLKANAARPADIDAALARLVGTGRSAMGALYKAMAVTPPTLGTVAGFAG